MAKIETTAFDSADYLNTAEDVAAYLDAYLEDGSPEEIRAALDTVARSHGISELSKLTGMSRAGLYKALGEGGNPSFETMRTILGALGLRFTVEAVEPELADA
jgi:probable addiction module antidote protein